MTMRLAAVAALLFASSLPIAALADPHAVGTRSGPFVATERSLTDLAKDGYEIRGNLGTALVLQKGASIFSCMIPPDPEHLSYRPYFVCSELREDPREGTPAPAKKGLAPGSR
ncbi:hypothetical protein [Parvibaculum sp.]|uniref:hypothetical protein n=1 Tax=Parvibaculum sp. TaxID=2024848 RepID=UPI002CC5ABFF|nr:hypothetical protein [Parvibaculum sp.]HUD49994.1 hypothetical protein [Parvibaculum sp.]